MTEIKTSPYLDENLLNVNKHENLAKNYASLKNSNGVTECKESRLRCKIVNHAEVSRALNCYLDKIRSISESNDGIVDEKLLNICREIRKLSNIPGNNQNVTNVKSIKSIVTDESLCLVTENEIPIIKTSQYSDKNGNQTESVSHPTSVSTNWNGPEHFTNMIKVTVDDFLIKQDRKKELNVNAKGGQNLDVFLHQTDNLAKNFFQADSEEKIQQNEFISNDHQRSDESLLEEKKRSIETDQNSEISEFSKERPFVCPKCKMAFKRNLHLKRHFTVTHTINKNFKCETCGKMFSRKDYLDKHVNGHQKKNFKLKLLQQGIVVRTKMFSKLNK